MDVAPTGTSPHTKLGYKVSHFAVHCNSFSFNLRQRKCGERECLPRVFLMRPLYCHIRRGPVPNSGGGVGGLRPQAGGKGNACVGGTDVDGKHALSICRATF